MRLLKLSVLFFINLTSISAFAGPLTGTVGSELLLLQKISTDPAANTEEFTTNSVMDLDDGMVPNVTNTILEINGYFAASGLAPSVTYGRGHATLTDGIVDLTLTPSNGPNVWMEVRERDNGNTIVIPATYEQIDVFAPEVVRALQINY